MICKLLYPFPGNLVFRLHFCNGNYCQILGSFSLAIGSLMPCMVYLSFLYLRHPVVNLFGFDLWDWVGIILFFHHFDVQCGFLRNPEYFLLWLYLVLYILLRQLSIQFYLLMARLKWSHWCKGRTLFFLYKIHIHQPLTFWIQFPLSSSFQGKTSINSNPFGMCVYNSFSSGKCQNASTQSICCVC